MLLGQSERKVIRSRAASSPSPRNWIVYYGSQEPADTFTGFPYVVFDSRYHPPISTLARSERKVVGYLSIGEASPDYEYFAELQRQGLLVRPSPTWLGNHYIDIRDQRWKSRVCDELVPWVLGKGFDGIFLDTLDSALSLEETDPERFSGMAGAAVDLIAEIRRRHPRAVLMLNRAYKLLPSVDRHLDVIVAESVYHTFDFASQRYVPVDESVSSQQVVWLQAARRRQPELLVFTLDYCDPRDVEAIRRAYEFERRHGFCPYVSSIDLTTVVPEPA
jgi:uncharacterized protein (TIGR01370 family)